MAVAISILGETACAVREPEDVNSGEGTTVDEVLDSAAVERIADRSVVGGKVEAVVGGDDRSGGLHHSGDDNVLGGVGDLNEESVRVEDRNRLRVGSEEGGGAAEVALGHLQSVLIEVS